MTDLEEKFIFLEISGEKGDVETYKKVLLDANTLNIKRILFACIWDGQEEKGKELLEEVQKMCRTLYIEPFTNTLGYNGIMYENAMVGTISSIEDRVVPNLNNLVSLEDYKNAKTKDKAGQAMNRFMEKLENEELTRREEPVDKKHIVTLDKNFVEEKRDDFKEMLSSHFGELINQVTNDTKKSLSLTPKDKEE